MKKTIRNTLKTLQDLGKDPEEAIIVISEGDGQVSGVWFDNRIEKHLEDEAKILNILITEDDYIICANL